MRLPNEPDAPAEINIVPMIDVIFSILAFFIISTLFLTRSEGLPVNLPKAGNSQAQGTAKITVTINPQGTIALNRQPVELEQLEAEVRKLIQSGQKAIAILNADEAVKHGKVVAVIDRLRRIEEVKLAIATKKPESSK
ncbi:MAG: ExbD/TolR family protein [Hormoscilla sp.]